MFLENIAGVRTAHLDVGKHVMAAILSLRSRASSGSHVSNRRLRQHATDLRPRAQFMTRPDRTGARNQYMVHGRVNRS